MLVFTGYYYCPQYYLVYRREGPRARSWHRVLQPLWLGEKDSSSWPEGKQTILKTIHFILIPKLFKPCPLPGLLSSEGSEGYPGYHPKTSWHLVLRPWLLWLWLTEIGHVGSNEVRESDPWWCHQSLVQAKHIPRASSTVVDCVLGWIVPSKFTFTQNLRIWPYLKIGPLSL